MTPPVTPAQSALIERLRDLLADEPAMREVSMFGGRSFMANEKIIASALKDGGLLVRVAAERHDELADQTGAAQAEMGAGREMGPGWIKVTSESISGNEDLSYWLEIAMEYNRAVTGGGA